MTDQDTDDTSDNASDGAAPGADVATSRYAESGKRKAAKPAPAKRGWVRRHWVISAFLALVIVIGTAAGAYAYMLNRNFANIDRVMISGGKDGLIEEERPDPVEGEALNILLLGADAESENNNNSSSIAEDMAQPQWPVGAHRSDTVIVMHISADRQNVYLASIPRDSYVDIPGYRRDKINAAYPATKALKAENMVEHGVTDRRQIELESATEGRATLVKTVERLTGVKVDHFAEVNLLGFSNLTKAVGGVDVCLNAPVNEPFSGANFPAGRQSISGGAALAFVRQRHGLPEGDLSRIRRQQVFMAAVARKILTAGTLANPAKLQELVDVAKQSVVIDSEWDVFSFAQQISSLAVGAIEFVTIPTAGSENNSRGAVLLVDRGDVQKFVQDRTGEREETTTETRSGDVVAPSSIIVDVRNSSGATGLAAQVSGQLSTVGYGPGDQDNAGSRTTSVVRYSGSDDRAASQVAELLGGMPIEQDGTVAGGHLRVYLGADYQRGTVLAPGEPSPVGIPSVAGTPAPITAGGVPCVD